MSNITIKSCPFCGQDASVEQFESAGGEGRMIWIVGCTNPDCEVTFQGHARKVDAIKAWNTRNDKAVVDEFLAAVRGHENKICRCLTVAECECFELAVIKVYAERFGGEE